MAQRETAGEHGGHDAHAGAGVHLPDPSIWPFAAGLASMLLVAALVWWARVEDQRGLSGPLLGASVALTLFSVAGWGYEDGRMRQKAREHEERERAAARRTQVVTFAIAEGQLEAATGADGVIAAIQARHDDLRAAPGFEDLRINVSPADDGPSQVIVETTWSSADELAAFEETERAILDLLARHPDEVAAGSPQTFDMQVVRDTKDTSVRYSMGMAVTLLGALLVGGFAVGAGLTLFASEGETSEGGGGPGPVELGPFAGTITIQASVFDYTEIVAPPGAELTFVLDNQDDSVAHNIVFYAGDTAGDGPVLTGCSAGCDGDDGGVRTELATGIVQHEFTFTTPPPGRYAFWCDVHPDTMLGALVVEEGAPVPGEAPPAEEPVAEEAGEGEAESGETDAGAEGEG